MHECLHRRSKVLLCVWRPVRSLYKGLVQVGGVSCYGWLCVRRIASLCMILLLQRLQRLRRGWLLAVWVGWLHAGCRCLGQNLGVLAAQVRGHCAHRRRWRCLLQ